MGLFRTTWLNFILASLLVVGLIGGWVFLISQIQQASERISTITAESSSRARERMQARNSVVILRNHTKDIIRMQQFFVDPEPIAFIKKLKETGTALQVQTTLGVGQAVTSDSKQIVFQISAEGTEKNVLQYLQALEYLPYITEMRDFTFSRLPTEAGQTAKLTVNLAVQTK